MPTLLKNCIGLNLDLRSREGGWAVREQNTSILYHTSIQGQAWIQPVKHLLQGPVTIKIFLGPNFD